MSDKKVLAFAGSTRKQSLNKILLKKAVILAQQYGLSVTEIDLKDYPLPLYNADDEDAYGLPDAAERLKELFLEHQGLLIASPEYNSAIAPLLKNTLDWLSRASAGEGTDLSAYWGKRAALLSASPSYYGGMRGLISARSILGSLGVTVIPQQVCVANAHEVLENNALFKQHYSYPLDDLCQSLKAHLSLSVSEIDSVNNDIFEV